METAAIRVWPYDYAEEFRRRYIMMHNTKRKPELRPNLHEFYRNNPKQWINDWAVTFNPRNAYPEPKVMPFLLFQRQEEFVDFLMDCLNDKEGGLVEKCRDIGATWLCCAFSVWMWLYIPGCSVGWGSRKADLVDRIGDMSSLFEKMRMIIDKLPHWMLPPKFTRRDHCHYMKIINPHNGSAITGESGDNIGRGGRSTIYFKDESAHYERPELVEASLGDNTDVQIDISSVNGAANVFYNRRMAGEVWYKGAKIPKGKTRVFIFDWRDHPGKTQEWYDTRKAKFDAEGLSHIFAQEVDRDYVASIQGIIIPPTWVRAAVDAHIELGISAEGEKIGALDVADGGKDKNALAMRHGIVLQRVDKFPQAIDTGVIARAAVNECAAFGVKEFYYDVIGVGSGIKTETNRLRDDDKMPRGLVVCPWNAAHSPLNPEEYIIPGDDKSPKNSDFYANLKAQAWWSLRTRFEKTYKCIVLGVYFPKEELISLDSDMPNLHEVMRELSQATYLTNTTGKLLVDKQPDGTPSPNLADSVVMCYHPTRELSILDVL